MAQNEPAEASQRGGGKALALHLLKTTENEHVEIHELRGFCSEDLKGAMKEAHAVSQGTKCRQYLFSVSLNPPETENVRTEIFEDALSRIEKKMGLENQPRAVVFHEKEGRRHAHAVWSRIDTDSMTAVQLSHFKMKLRDISREIYLENGWKLPRGLMNSKERDPRNFTLEEWQQAKRSGHNARDLKEAIQECWAASDSRAAFERALETRGLYLARGDRRGHVALTYEGEAFSIARVTGRKSKDIETRLGDPTKLRSVEQTKAHIASQVAPRIQRMVNEVEHDRAAAMKPLNDRRHAMRAAHAAERDRMHAAQKARQELETRQRAERLRTGVRGLWDRVTGERGRAIKQNEAEAMAALKRDADQRETLRAAQLSDRRKLQTEIVAVRHRFRDKVQSLHADLNKLRENATSVREKPMEVFRSAASPEPQPQQQKAAPSPERAAKPSIPTPAERLQRLRENQPNQTRQAGRDFGRE